MVELKSIFAHIGISLLVSTTVVICNNIFYNRKPQDPPKDKPVGIVRLLNQLN